jgi:hypothetical protein
MTVKKNKQDYKRNWIAVDAHTRHGGAHKDDRLKRESNKMHRLYYEEYGDDEEVELDQE